MRMWGLNPELLCNQHLLGEHVEMHMFAGTIQKGRSIKGYITKNLVDPSRIGARHDELATEMRRRKIKHTSDFPTPFPDLPQHPLSIQSNEVELCQRCSKCRARIQGRNS